ncbi:hypothetical protein B5S29_g4238 [[Candida] boidinii]|uniref:Unnamed protein product n=1 Tax=Candida boidinii TaxID=5477 RepID=A0ACB5TU11_CANBO|nr:hypothetical protein B5S29_g4238 [[Candida] boidinii]GME93817.1 unnamed protein product [[Candida] boidinii]
MKVAFIHPDLGIGGAERLIVDAAMAMKELGNDVTVYTSHCDKTHCFEEVKREEFKVNVIGDFVPTNLFGKFSIVFAFLRQLILTFTILFNRELFQYDLIILDQLPYSIPILHFFKKPETKILFYCHFPDQLLAPHDGTLRKIYRFFYDMLEEFSTSCSDKVVVNSKFTKEIVYSTFPSLKNQELSVVYPCIPSEIEIDTQTDSLVEDLFGNKNPYFLSINRFENKKNVSLAIESFAKFLNDPSSCSNSSQKLVIAGGYDSRVNENIDNLNKLKKLCIELNLKSTTVSKGDLSSIDDINNYNVIFLTSISTPLKNSLIKNCDLLLYTPSFEHFGIVPIEAMSLGKLVLATNTGGPLETVVNYFEDKKNFTGFTVDSDSDEWFKVLKMFKNDFSKLDIEEGSKRSIKRATNIFSFNALTNTLSDVISQTTPVVFNYEEVIRNSLTTLKFMFIIAISYLVKKLF